MVYLQKVLYGMPAWTLSLNREIVCSSVWPSISPVAPKFLELPSPNPLPEAERYVDA